MSCQPHRVTPGQSNSGHQQIHISKLFPHIYQPSVKSVYKTNQTGKETDREGYRQRRKQTETEKETDREGHRQGRKQTEKETDREGYRQIGRKAVRTRDR